MTATFDIALEKRYATLPDIALVDITATDSLLIRDSATGVVLRLPFSVLVAAINTALVSVYEPAIALGTTGQYWRGDKSWQTLNKAAVGLGSVDNTADSAKSVSYAATAGAAPASDVYSWAKASVKPSYTKSEVGLSNVDNTTDAGKPVSTSQQTALDLKANLASPSFIGAVGMGVTPNTWNSIVQAIDLPIAAIITTSGTAVQMVQNGLYGTDATWRYQAVNYASRYRLTGGGFNWFVAASGAAIGDPITWITAMTLTNNGNLLVGTTTDGMTAGGSLAVAKDFAHRGTKVGFNNVTPVVAQISGGTTAGVIAGLVALGLFSS